MQRLTWLQSELTPVVSNNNTPTETPSLDANLIAFAHELGDLDGLSSLSHLGRGTGAGGATRAAVGADVHSGTLVHQAAPLPWGLP